MTEYWLAVRNGNDIELVDVGYKSPEAVADAAALMGGSWVAVTVAPLPAPSGAPIDDVARELP